MSNSVAARRGVRLFLRIVAFLLPLSMFGHQAWGQWVETLPRGLRDSVLWIGDHEEGSLADWEYPGPAQSGGGVFNTGDTDVEALASREIVHSGRFAVRTTITNAYRAQNGRRAVRLLRWTDQPWNAGGRHFPATAFYSTWMYFADNYNPKKFDPWDPGDGGWWNVFQFKSIDSAGASQPMWGLNIGYDEHTDTMYFYLTSHSNADNSPRSYHQSSPKKVIKGRWLHVEALYEQDSDYEGRIAIWQDGENILDISNVRTILSSPVHWGIGNYTDHISGGPVEGKAIVYFDDAVVSLDQLSSTLIDETIDASR